jgi:hypothetical protein
MSRKWIALLGLGVGGYVIYQLLKPKPTEEEKREEKTPEEIRRECRIRVSQICAQSGGTLRDRCLENEVSIASYECVDTIYQCCLTTTQLPPETPSPPPEAPQPGEGIIGIAGGATVTPTPTPPETQPPPEAPAPAPSPPQPSIICPQGWYLCDAAPTPYCLQCPEGTEFYKEAGFCGCRSKPQQVITTCPPPLEYYCDPALDICYCRQPPEPFTPAPGCPQISSIPSDWCEYCKLLLRGCIRPTVADDYRFCLNVARGYIAFAPCLGCPPEDFCPELRKIYEETVSRTPTTTQPITVTQTGRAELII